MLMVGVCLGQAAPAKKAYTFHGKVEAVNAGANTVTVNGEKVKGWMDAMTMGYKVDDPAVLKNVKVGVGIPGERERDSGMMPNSNPG